MSSRAEELKMSIVFRNFIFIMHAHKVETHYNYNFSINSVINLKTLLYTIYIWDIFLQFGLSVNANSTLVLVSLIRYYYNINLKNNHLS